MHFGILLELLLSTKEYIVLFVETTQDYIERKSTLTLISLLELCVLR